ncbi:MAG: hypothetical protein LBI36_00645 [Oscillospiraceae bacterium]|jgi:hypothetical protein|nr:hypothetical protein [Oscillospiraceae bacterium]
MKKKLLKIFFLCCCGLTLTGCEFNQETFNKALNYVVYAIGIVAAGTLLFFLALALVGVFYKGKKYSVKVLKKHEFKFKRRKGFSLRGSQTNARYARSKIDVEINGKKKTVKCEDNVILDKLSVGKTHNLRIRFNTINKILK